MILVALVVVACGLAFGFGTSIDVDTDATSYFAGDVLTVSLSAINMTPMDSEVDLYLAFEVPSGEYLFYPAWSSELAPAISGVALSGGARVGPVDFLQIGLPSGSPPIEGLHKYNIHAGLAAAGTLDFDSINTVRFNVLRRGAWETYSNSNEIRDLLLQDDGTVYAATTTGFIEANPGTGHYKKYTTADGLPYPSIQSITLGPDGALWLGAGNPMSRSSGGGVIRYESGRFKAYTTEEGLLDDWVSGVAFDSAGRMWCSVFGGVSCYDGTFWRSYTVDDGLAKNWGSAIMVDSQDRVWLPTRSGVSVFEDGSWRTYKASDGLPSDKVHCVNEDPQGRMWFGTNAGASRFDGETFTNFTTADGLAEPEVDCIAFEGDDVVWFGTRPLNMIGLGPVCRLQGGTWTTYTSEDGIASNVFCFAFDAIGNLWAGTYGKGLCIFDGSSWHNFYLTDGPIFTGDTDVRSLAVSQTGELWCGAAYMGGLSSFDGANWALHDEAGPYVSALKFDADSNLLIATQGGAQGSGLVKFDGETWTYYREGGAPDWVNCIAIDDQHRVWCGLGGNGVAILDGETWSAYTSEDHSVLAGAVTDIEMGAFGDLWVSAVEHPQFGGGGVAHFDGATWTGYTTDDGLPTDKVYCLALAQDGTVWVGMDEEGVSFFDGITWTKCSEEDVPHADVLMADYDSAGRLWLGGMNGVTMYDGAGFRQFDCGLGFPGYWAYGMAEGPDGRVWFATSGGVGGFSPDS